MLFVHVISALCLEMGQTPTLLIARGSILPFLLQSSYNTRHAGLQSFPDYINSTQPSLSSSKSQTGTYKNFSDFLNSQAGHLESAAYREPMVPLSFQRYHRHPLYQYERHHYSVPRVRMYSESLEDAVKGNKDLGIPKPKEVHNGWKIFLFLAFMVMAASVGFYLGKINESRNYVRVPAPELN